MSLKPTDIKYYVHTNNGATPLNNTWGALISVLDSCLLTGYSSQSVTLYEITGTVLKLTFGSAHNYLPGQVLKISGANQTEFNTEFRISIVPTTTTLHIDLSTAIASKGLSGTLTTILPSLGWTSEFSDTGKRAYRNADITDTTRPYLRVVDIRDTLYNDTYAKYAKVGMVDSMTNIDTMSGVQTPYDPTLPDKNWIASGPSGTSATINGWAKWYYSRIRDVYFGNYFDSEGNTASNKRWLIVGNKDWIYVLPSQVVSQYCNVYFFGKLILENNETVYGLSSSLNYDTAQNNKATCVVTPLSSDNKGFLFHSSTFFSSKTLSFIRSLKEVPSAINNQFENIETKFLYSDVWISNVLPGKVYRTTMPSFKWNLNPFNSSYDVKTLEADNTMFLTKTIHASHTQLDTELPMLVAFDLLGTS